MTSSTITQGRTLETGARNIQTRIPTNREDMSGKFTAKIIDRRAFILSAAQAALLLSTVAVASAGKPSAPPEPSELFIKAYANLTATATPITDAISLTLPDFFDNGHAVPFTISIKSPMSDADHITKIYILSTANPLAEVAAFHLTTLSGAAIVSGRFRLAKSQDVHVLAQRADGTLLAASQYVKVAIGGCS